MEKVANIVEHVGNADAVNMNVAVKLMKMETLYAKLECRFS